MQISIQNISLSFGDRDILKNISFTINEKSRIALVGANGEGKSTLMKIIAGLDSADSGMVTKDKNTSILYATQSGATFKGITLKDEVFKIFNNFPKEDHEKERIFSMVAKGLGFKTEDYTKDCSTFSQGYQMRISLLKVLVAKPDFMLLDEPTNYLDIETRLWLLKYLNSLTGGYILVSHDRYFLDETVNEVFEIEKGNLTRYKGGYTSYESERIKNAEFIVKKAQEQEKLIKKTEAFVEKFRYKATKSKQVQSRIKALEKLELIELPKHLKHIKFSIPYVGFSPNDILKVENVTKYYGNKCIFKDVSFQVRKKERLVIVGRNGMGKSTLLRLITKTEDDYTGNIKFGENISFEYFKGDESLFVQGKDKNEDSLTVFEYASKFGEGDEQYVKNMLGAFMFQGDDIEKNISVLSGGERSRLELLSCIMHKSNLLILDEPTNHLDIASKDMLINAIKNYEGTVIFVSHDVNFIQEISTKTLHIENGKVEYFDGGWDYFSDRMKERNTESNEFVFGKIYNKDDNDKNTVITESISAKKLSYQEAKKLKNERNSKEKRINKLEKDIEEITEKTKILEKTLESVEVYSSHEKSKQTLSEIENLKNMLKPLEEEWLKLNEEI